jgi:hypothetical protein
MCTPEFCIEDTTTFWSEQDLVKLIREKNPTLQLKEVNEAFSLEFARDSEEPFIKCFLKYGSVRVLDFIIQYINYREDYPEWQKKYNASTNTHTYRLFINNRPSWCGTEGEKPPDTIYIKPEGYQALDQLAWQYHAIKKQNYIEIMQMNGTREGRLLHTLGSADFGSFGDQWRKWLRDGKSIVMLKHYAYIAICPSAHLTRKRNFEKESGSMMGPRIRYFSHVMSAEETAWVSDNEWSGMRNFPPPAAAGPVTAMLGALLQSIF